MGILVLYIFTNISSYQMKERKNEEHPTPWHFIISLPCPWWAPYSEGGGCMLVSSYSCGLAPPFFGLLLPAIKNLIVFVLKMHNYTKWNTSKHLLTRLVYRAYLKSFNGRLCILNQEIITEFHYFFCQLCYNSFQNMENISLIHQLNQMLSFFFIFTKIMVNRFLLFSFKIKQISHFLWKKGPQKSIIHAQIAIISNMSKKN